MDNFEFNNPHCYGIMTQCVDAMVTLRLGTCSSLAKLTLTSRRLCQSSRSISLKHTRRYDNRLEFSLKGGCLQPVRTGSFVTSSDLVIVI